MGEGNAFQRELVGPAAERLLAVRPGERVLDELAEPTFGPGRAVPGVSWFNCPDIPPAPVAGARPVGASGGGAEPGDRAE